MEENSVSGALNKVADVIVQALGILDYSYIISGVMSYLLIVFTLSKVGLFDFGGHSKLFYVVALFISYVLGLISWLIGKKLRRWSMKLIMKSRSCFGFPKSNIEKKQTDFEIVFNEFKKHTFGNTEIEHISDDTTTAYAQMWKSLYKEDSNANDVDLADVRRIRRYWVMQAVFEGLIGTCVIGICCSIFLIKREIIPNCSFYSFAILPMWFFLMYLFGGEAKKCAETQIKEVVTSYYKYHCN